MSDPKLPSRCCHGFVLPDTMTFEAARWQFRTKLAKLRELSGLGLMREHREGMIEDLRTLQFLVPITLAEVSPQLRVSLSQDVLRVMKTRGEVVWTCKFFHGETGRCGIYPHRPGMCKQFPPNDTEGLEHGHNALCHRCSSTYCKYHPETVA